MNFLTILFALFGAVLSIYGWCMLYFLRNDKSKLRNNYLLGIALFWVALMLPVITKYHIPGIEYTFALYKSMNALIIICVFFRSLIAITRTALAKEKNETISFENQMLCGTIGLFIIYTLYADFFYLLDKNIYYICIISVVVYFGGIWYYEK